MGERRLDRADELRRRGSARVVLVCLGHVPCGGEVVRERACLLVGLVAHDALDRFPDLAMQLCAPGARELVVDRFSNQGVGEAVVPDRGLADDLRGYRLLEAVGDLLGGRAGDGLDDVQRELSTGYRSDCQHALAAVVESAQAPDEEVLDRLGDPRERLCEVGLRGDVPQQLLDEERIALRALDDRARNHGWDRAARLGGDHRRDLLLAEPFEPERLKRPRAAELGECPCERVCLIHLRVPIGAEDQQGRPLGGAYDMPQQQQRRRDRPNEGRPGRGSAAAPRRPCAARKPPRRTA